MWNYLTYVNEYRASLRALQDARYMEYPAEVSLETLALCNAACDFCPYPGLSRKGTAMSDALIDKVLDDCRAIPADLPFQMNLTRVNEPFLDTRIFDIMGKIAALLPNAGVITFTNASPLNDRNLSRLASASNVSRLVISLHDFRPENYERLMRIPFERTIRNVRALHKLKEDGAIRFPVEVSRVGDGTSFDQEFCEWGRREFPLFTIYSTARADWLGAVDTLVSPVPDASCSQFFKVNILADGKAAFCCIDSEGLGTIGDAGRQHILEIYNHPSRYRLRKTLTSRLQLGSCARCSLMA